ncbi:MAG: ATP synthase F0 subunit B [Deltaproteobacteria bacterium]|nr:ATP synthase F0 subunit B [Deltaproteobacteria bacterium]
MKRWWTRARTGLLAAIVAAAPVLSWAAEHAEGESAGTAWLGLLWKLVNFGILAGMLFYFLRKTVTQGLADRQSNLRQALAEARDAKGAAEAKHREFSDKVARLEEEVKAIQEEFRAEGERQRERILRDAHAAAENIRSQAETAGANEVKRVTDELRAELADVAVRIAEDILNQAYTAQDQKKAVQETIDNIERVH